MMDDYGNLLEPNRRITFWSSAYGFQKSALQALICDVYDYQGVYK